LKESGEAVMVRKWFVALGIVSVVLIALIAFIVPKAEKNQQPTGYPNGEIQIPHLFYAGKVYIYTDQTTTKGLPDGYEKVGAVESIDNKHLPSKDFMASRLCLGQEVYAQSQSEADFLYVSAEKPDYYMIFKSDTR